MNVIFMGTPDFSGGGGIKEFRFTTNSSSMRVAQYRENSNASVYFLTNAFSVELLLQL